MCRLAINIASFTHLLKSVDFDAILDHLALTRIIKSNAELTTARIKRLLEILSSIHLTYTIEKEKTWYLLISYLGNYMRIAIHM